MTKNEKSKKGRTTKRLILGALLLASLGTGTVSLAKYVKKYNGSNKTANIAQLGITVTPSTNDVFTTSYKDGSNNTILGYKTSASSTSELVGPGASGTTPTFDIVDSNSRNVPIRITSYLRITYSSHFKFLTDQISNDDFYTPINIKDESNPVLDAPFFDSNNNVIGVNKYLKDNTSITNVLCKEEDGECIVEIKGSSTEYGLDESCNVTNDFGYSWEWAFELSDANYSADQIANANAADTKLCTASGSTIKITSLLVVEQIIK